ncbi:MAG: adenine phosphoribosyltransferase [Planctomycetes bacterium]|nr:adenine phosphoribosyltransferase [Planctomycetota bacterium]
MQLKSYIREVPDFPRPGIGFKDITTLLLDPAALREAVRAMAAPYREEGVELVCGAEARGFPFACAIALELGAGFVPIRKPGKLPAPTRQVTYSLEYGSDELHVHRDAVRPGQRVLLVDDLLATGGTMVACLELVHAQGARVVGCCFLVELDFLRGRERLGGTPVHSIIHYDAE